MVEDGGSGATIDPQTGVVSWKAAPPPGTYYVQVGVNNGRLSFVRDSVIELTIQVGGSGTPVAAASSITRKVAKGQVQQYEVQFSAPLLASSATNKIAYRLVISAGKDKKFGTRDDKVVKIKSVAYDASSNMIKLKPATRVRPGQKLTIVILDSLVRDAQGTPIDGDGDGKPGGTLVRSLSTKA
jgi:hypothetical protein